MRAPGTTLVAPDSESISLWLVKRNDRLGAELIRRKGAEMTMAQYIPFAKVVALGKPVMFFMTWQDDGTVLASVDDSESYSMHLDKPVSEVALLTSGSQADFTNIQPGLYGPANTRCTAATAP